MVNSTSIHLITYGNINFNISKKKIVKEAKESAIFDTVKAYAPNDLPQSFRKKFEHILKEPRLGGYCIWKPCIIRERLKKIQEGDFLVYVDAGCTLNKKGGKRFDEYLEMLNKSKYGILSFSLRFKEKEWTTKEIFNYFNVELNSEIAESVQLVGGILIMKKNSHLIKIIDLWYNTLIDNPLLFTDAYNENQIPEFKENRHDQSVFSIIRKIHGTIIINEIETYFTPFGSEQSLAFPIWATRRRESKQSIKARIINFILTNKVLKVTKIIFKKYFTH